jgi:hypothetical protein
VVNTESWADGVQRPRRALRLDALVEDRSLGSWKISQADEEALLAASDQSGKEAKLVIGRNFEFKLPLNWLFATPVSSLSGTGKATGPVATRLRLRFSLWQNRLPVDALPLEGWIELQLLSEQDLAAHAF